MPKYTNNRIFMGFGEKSVFSLNFYPYYSMAMWKLWAKKLINTILMNLWSFHLKTMIPLFLCNSGSNFQRKPQKKENNDNQIFYFIFCIFLKNRMVEFNFQRINEFCMIKYPNNRIFMGFGEKRCFSPNFCSYYSMAIWKLWAKKIDQYHFG